MINLHHVKKLQCFEGKSLLRLCLFSIFAVIYGENGILGQKLILHESEIRHMRKFNQYIFRAFSRYLSA